MKRSIYNNSLSLLFAIITLGGILLAGCNNTHKNPVKSRALQPFYQAGVLKPIDTIIKHTFYIKSTGTADLLIDSVGGSCSCISITWDKEAIHPGDSAAINVSVQSDITDSKGKNTQQIIAKTNSSTPFTVFKIAFTR